MDLHTRNRYMKAMGIPVWMPATPSPDPLNSEASVSEPMERMENTVPDRQQAAMDVGITHAPHPSHSEPVVSDTGQINPPPAPTIQEKPDKPVPATVIQVPDCSAMGWGELQDKVKHCQLCVLSKSRTRTVFGTGDTQADWMIIGEAPGAEEDRQGEPFVGRAGKLLNNMLAAIGLPRNAAYISNILKCRPPNNRDPKPEEAALCRGYLERQIALVKPVLIMVVGRIAAHNLLQTTTPLGRLRGQVHTLPDSDIPVIVTYHPAYLLRQPAEKRKAWQDLQLARQVMVARQR